MNRKKLKLLLIIEQCNPEMASVPLVAYKFFQAINKLVDATLVNHEPIELSINFGKARTEM